MELLLDSFVFISPALILLSGVFSLFYSAIELCRKSRLEKERGKRYKQVLKILEKPENLMLSCRLWSSILRVPAVCFGFIFLFNYLYNHTLVRFRYIIIIFFVFTIVYGIIITLLGEALPKLLSRIKPEKTAAFLLPAMKILSVPMMPFTLPAGKFASFFKTAMKTDIDERITEDELRDALIEGEKSGIVESKERTMVEGVFYLGDRPVAAFMTHRSEIQYMDINDSDEEIRAKAIEYRQQQCFPVVIGSPDEIAGAVYLEDIILNQSQEQPRTLRAIMKKAQFVPGTMSALKAFESFKQGQSNFLFVMDEYGGLAGIMSIKSLIEEIVGELSTSAASEEPIIRQEDGSWLVDGTLNIDDAAQALSLTGLSEEGDFHTLAGLVLHLAGELPKVGDSFEYQGYKFKVIDKDGNRIDKLLITKIEE